MTRFIVTSSRIGDPRKKITASYGNELLYICVVHYSRNGLRPPIYLFSDTEEELKYLEDKGLRKARIDLLASLGRFVEVAEVHLLSLGQPYDAIRTLLEHQDNHPGAMQRAADIALDTLRRECSFDTAVHDILRSKESDSHKVLNCIKDVPLAPLKLTDSREVDSVECSKVQRLAVFPRSTYSVQSRNLRLLRRSIH
ncbi:hypothetical protein F5J12DRAFT_529246 [Pisolithus orientalis]|uniref:uncharacterized protein n=1 Tax=Pisolithus orientalis TaxID=936130 RepID=UPI0022245BE4|nr:uncharacterized protein F5J12DRAFT_529246 [Pisolithus orientalis]KAI5988272.1 hypothetical protein F5J12DRAFT_529246 [Pisolithus orientalis]